jgi:hypothetical protein
MAWSLRKNTARRCDPKKLRAQNGEKSCHGDGEIRKNNSSPNLQNRFGNPERFFYKINL